MQENFWNDLPRPFFILAPMENVTNVAFRHVVSEAAGPDVFFTEFTNADSYCHPEGKFSVRDRLTYEEEEQPIVAHIWGDNPDHFREMSVGLAEEGFKGIDINMGCPAPNVAPKGKGCGLIRRPDIAEDIIQAAKAGGLPVSVKTRLGYTEVKEWRDWLTHLLEQDIVNLTIHLRTKKEMSKVDAHWELIPEIKKLRDDIAPNTLLTINGDIPDREMGMKLVEDYGVDGIMIGRGVFHNPFVFEKEPTEHSAKEHFDLLRLHLKLQDDYFSESSDHPFKALRRFFKIYVRGVKGAGQLRNQLTKANSSEEVHALLDGFEEQENIGQKTEVGFH